MPPETPVVHLIAAARPNFMKIAPVYHELSKADWCEPRIVHTGQHYDPNMSDSFFDDLKLPEPHIHLGVGSGTHAEQTGRVMMAYEKVCMEDPPAWIIVVGDVNSTMACTLVGAKLHIPVAHLEAGLRSGDRRMPEEINRLVTDAIADLLWTPSPDGDENLLREGVAAEKIERVGNVMIDSYKLLESQIAELDMPAKLGLDGDFAVVTLHRPSNVDTKAALAKIVDGLVAVAKDTTLVFPLHPRTRARLEEFDLLETLSAPSSIHILEPLGYQEFMSLVSNCKFILTDSGGVQEESSYLGIPCLTLRENTERPVTVTEGSNRLIHAGELKEAAGKLARQEKTRTPGTIDLWDGRSAARIAESLEKRIR